MRRPWTAGEDQFIRHNYSSASPADIAERLDRTKAQVVWRAGMLGVRTPRNPVWTDAENQFLRDNYPTMPDEEIGAKLGRSFAAVNHQAGRLGIIKAGPNSDWTGDEDDLLRDLYGTLTAGRIADLLGRSETAIVHRAMRVGVRRRPLQPKSVPKVISAWTLRRDSVRHDYFAEVDSPVKAYVLGWLASDGNVKADSNAIRLRVNAKDEEMLRFIRDELAPLHGITNYEGRRPSGEMSTMSRFEVGSERMKRDLAKLGVTPNKSLTIQYPRIPAHLDNSFILGYFDGDGSLFRVDSGRRWKWTITCASKPLLLAVQRRIKDATGIEPNGPHLHDRARSPHTHHIAKTGAGVVPIDAWLHADVPGLARKRIGAAP